MLQNFKILMLEIDVCSSQWEGSYSLEGVDFIQIQSGQTKLQEFQQNVYLPNVYSVLNGRALIA